ncbi:cytochrome P450 [Haloferax larsenii]|uniref:Cytochrome P450 n=1 Tax=Haloferax larsenii TaxID=302484 RepID=A0ABY5RG92_HALLR|nr:cytochrome P450 [Haloferax larsenii]UVE50908.1 cytochrome P450 [Haloferax larsenii]
MTAHGTSAGDESSPPTPSGVPLLGNGPAFSRDPVGAMEEWASLGDLVRLEVPGQTTYLVTGAELIEQILVTDHESYTISPAQHETFEGIEDHAVTVTTGERWTRLRRVMRPALTHGAVQRYADRIVETTEDYVEEWDDGEHIDLYREMRLLTVNVLADALLDADVRGREAVVMDAADALVDRANLRRLGQLLPDWVPTPTDRRFERTVRELDAFVDDLIAERRNTGLGEDFCSVLLDAHDAGTLSIDEVRHNLVAMLLAGHDSPSIALTHALRLLDDHSDVRDALLAESGDVLGGDGSASGAYADLERTQNVVSETLRLYPPTLAVTRQATEPVTIAGYDLPAGAQFLLPQWPVHRDERYWDEPTVFDPSRWQEPESRPGYAYFPFSAGPRNCVGMHFARTELTLILATVLDRVELDVSMDGPLAFAPSLQLRPETDIEATVHRR